MLAQSATTGALAGIVLNQAGDPVPNAAVTIVFVATSQTHDSVTAADGGYRFSMVSPGAYEVHFAAQGFKTSRLAAVTVNISEVATLDATLERGDASEQVPCQCRTGGATASTGTVVDSKTLTSVPLTTRNFTQILSMASGSAADVNNAGTLGRGTRGINVNGNTNAGAYTLDGANAPSAVPNPDTISELKIQPSQYDAAYGAQVPTTALITKSGEKDFHVDGWEFVSNDIFNFDQKF